MDSYNSLIKIVVIGDSGVGKSNLVSRYCMDEFNVEQPTTIGVEFMMKELKHNDRIMKLQLWDTAGQERFRAICSTMYHGARGAMVVYDITSRRSFDNVPKWLSELVTYVPENTVLMLVGNKCDLEEDRAVPTEVAQKYAAQNALLFLEASALDTTNVDKAFSWLAAEVFDRGAAMPLRSDPLSNPAALNGQPIHITEPPTPSDGAQKVCCKS